MERTLCEMRPNISPATMTSVILVLCFLQLLMINGATTYFGSPKALIEYYRLSEQYPFNDAKRNCSERGSRFGLPSGKLLISNIANASLLNGTWIGLHRRISPQWKWMDGSEYKPLFGDKAHHFCAACEPLKEELLAVKCSQENMGFVCQSGGADCPERHMEQACTKLNGVWYVVGVRAASWYDARNYCLRIGADMAKLHLPPIRRHISNFIIRSKLSPTFLGVFVGLRREEWISEIHDQAVGTPSIANTRWMDGYPKVNDSCAVFEVKQGELKWKSKDCKQKAPTVCQNYVIPSPPSTSAAVCPDGSMSEHRRVWTALGILLALFVIIFACSFLVIHWYIDRIKTRNEYKTSFIKEVKLWATNKFGKRQVPPSIKQSDLPTVVVFSTGIDKGNEALKNAEIEHLDWPDNDVDQGHSGTEKARWIAKAFEGKSDSKEKKNIPKTKYFRIVNISAVKVKGTLPRKRVKVVLNYLADNIDSFDVVILPNFKPLQQQNDANEALTALLKIKSKVALCPAVRLRDMPTREVIAVGIIKEKQEASEISAATDFVVDIPPNLPMDKSLLLGASILAGIMLRVVKSFNTNERDGIPFDTRSLRRSLIRIFNPDGKHSLEEAFAVVSYKKLDILKLKEILQRQKNEKSNRRKYVSEDRKRMIVEIEQKEKGVSQFKDEVLQSVKNYEFKSDYGDETNGYEITTGTLKIAIIGQGFNHEDEDFKDIHIENVPNIIPDDLESIQKSHSGTDMLRALVSYLSNGEVGKTVLRRWIQLFDAPVMPGICQPDWDLVSNCFSECTKEKYDIVFIHPMNFFPPSGHRILRNLHKLKKNSIVITGATAANVLPLNFPAEAVIAVATFQTGSECEDDGDSDRKNEENSKLLKKNSIELNEIQGANEGTDRVCKLCGGATVDFLSSGCNKSDGSQKQPEVWAGPMQTVAISALILLMAQERFTDPEKTTILGKLHETATMHKVLRGMAWPNTQHDFQVGWGLLQPWDFLREDNKERFKAVIRECVNHNSEKEYYWAGKNF